jgi:phage terminase small subunit
MRGRKPVPSALKLLRGNPGRRKAVREVEPPVGAEAPAWLPADARAHWDRIAPGLVGVGLLTILDADSLAIYCTLLAYFVRLAQQGLPSAKIAAELRQQGGRFGLSPQDRLRVHSAPRRPAGPGSQLSQFVPPGPRPV